MMFVTGQGCDIIHTFIGGVGLGYSQGFGCYYLMSGLPSCHLRDWIFDIQRRNSTL